MAELDGLIDSKISLISQEDVKFDGTLFSINAEESSMVLKDVQCLGTEDRVTDPAKIIPANSTIIPFVTFPGQEIKDLIVHDPTPAAAPAPAPAPVARVAPQPRARPTPQPRPTPAPSAPAPAPQQRNPNPRPPQPPAGAMAQAPRQQQPRREAPQEPRGAAGTGAYLSKLKEKKIGEEVVADTPKGEFDFSAGLSMFKKSDEMGQLADENSGQTKYVKDDFFDSLGGDSKDRSEGRKTRMSASEERSLNQDTFGAVALQGNNRRYYRGGGGGQGRGGGGGRGGGRGRGRGRGGNGMGGNMGSMGGMGGGIGGGGRGGPGVKA